MASNRENNPPSSRLSEVLESTRDSTEKSKAQYLREYRPRNKPKLDSASHDYPKRRKTAAEYQHEYRARKNAETLKQAEHGTRLLDSINIDPCMTTCHSTSAEKSTTVNLSTSDGSATNNLETTSKAKKIPKTSAEKQRNYRARKKAKYGNISVNSETTALTTTTTHPGTNNGPSTSGAKMSKEPRRRKTAAQYQREYRERLKLKRFNNLLNFTTDGSTTSAESSSTIIEKTNDQTNVNIKAASGGDIPRNNSVDDTRTDHDTQSNQKLPLTNRTPSPSGAKMSKKPRRRKTQAQYQREYRERLKLKRLNDLLNSMTYGLTTSAKSISTIIEKTNNQMNVNIKNANGDDIPRNKSLDDTGKDYDRQSHLKLLLAYRFPSKRRIKIQNSPRKRKSAAQYQREYRERLKARRMKNLSNSTTDGSTTSAKDASGDDIPKNNNINNTKTDHDPLSSLQPSLTNCSSSTSRAISTKQPSRRKSAAQYQREYRQRLKARRMKNLLNSATNPLSTDAGSPSTVTEKTQVPEAIPEPPPFNDTRADPSSEIKDDLQQQSIARKRDSLMPNVEFFESLQKTNDLQRSVSLEIIDHLTSNQLQPLRVFLIGPPGRGKTFVIWLILELYHKYATTKVHCNAYLICALTGKAAVAINGTTIHTALSLSTRVDNSLSADILQQFRSLFEHIRVVIIDEVTVAEAELLDRVDRRLQLITGKSNVPFGGLDIILIGDLIKLPSVKATPINKQSEQCIGSQFWRSFKFHELTEIIRQSNVVFSTILTKIKNGDQLNKEETTLLESRFVTEEEANRLCPHGLRLAYFNNTVDVYNRLILKNRQEKIISEAVDFISGCENDEERENACSAVKNRKLAAETGGLLHRLTLVVGKYYTITTNIAFTDGLAKGSTGKLAHIEKNDNGEVTRVWLLFPSCKTIGIKARTAMSAFMLANDINPLAVPIDRRDATFYLNKQRIISAKRNHFPLVPGCSLKIKKSQMGSFDEVVYYYHKSQSKQLVDVAMSRATSIEGLYIIPVNKQKEFYHGSASNYHASIPSQNEMTKLCENSLEFLKQELCEDVGSKSGLSVA